MPKSTSPSRSATAGDVLGPMLRHRVAAFRTREAQVRLDEPDAAHRFQVSARRLRSLMAGFGTLLDPMTCAALEGELRDTARTVDGARDAQVVRRRLESLLASEPDSSAVVHVRNQLTDLLARSYAESWQQAIAHFDSPAYDSFTRALDRFADLPPWTPEAEAPAHRVLVPALRQEWARLLRKGRGVQELEAGPERDHRLYAVHRAAKRAQDVAEAQETVSGRRVKRLRKAARGLTMPLGEHHDLVLTGELLGRASTELGGTDLAGTDGVVHRLRSREAAAAGELYAAFVRSFRDADRKSLRSWMS